MRTLLSGIVELLRPPNVFTAVADSLAGLALARLGALSASEPALWCLAASAALYLAGMALNDFFDREVDARERPLRPIPSGRVPAPFAAALGAALLGAGLLFAAAAGAPSFAVAMLLAASIVSYDGGLKATAAGPVNMGLCRTLNFAMPMALAAAALPAAFFAAPLVLGAYVATLTYLAREEVSGNTPERVRRGLGAMAAVALAALASLVALGGGVVGSILFAIAAGRGLQLLVPLLRDPSPAMTGRAIGGGILLIPVIDAVFVAAAGFAAPALAVAALALPALGLRRWYSPT